MTSLLPLTQLLITAPERDALLFALHLAVASERRIAEGNFALDRCEASAGRVERMRGLIGLIERAV